MLCLSMVRKTYGRRHGPFKSWGEQQIARLLDRNSIAYHYEYPLAVYDQGKLRVYYPDFQLPQLGVLIEYFGVNGDSVYNQQTRHKLEVYRQAGIDGIYLNRDSLRGDWPAKVLGRIEETLKNRLDRFYQTRQGR